MKNNLVIYPDEISISKNYNIFIDCYCFDNYKNKIDFKYNILEHNLNERSSRIQSYKDCNEIFYLILNQVREKLNKVHNVDNSNQFYEILIGAWLRKFIQQFYFKFKLINKAVLESKVDEVTILNYEDYNFFTSQTHTIQMASNNTIWSACLYSYIIDSLNKKKNLGIEINKINQIEKNFDDSEHLDQINYNNKNLKYILKNLMSKIISFFPNKTELFSYDLGISSLTEKKLDIIFSQFPRFYNTKFKLKYSQYSSELRKEIYFDNFEENVNLEEIINLLLKILKKSLPISILEDYKSLEKKTKKINFPKKPKYIFTSYAFESNEVFKFYLANQKKYNKNVKYLVYQHGGSYITRIDNSYNNECKTADTFLCWGEKIDKNLNNNINFFNFKLSNKKYFIKNKSNKLLVILRSSGYNAVPYDRYLEGKRELEFTLDFLNRLPDYIKSDVLIRAHSGSKGKLKMYDNILNKFEIDYGDKNYFESINNSKIIFFNHDSTGLLEMLGCNKPTICAWPNFSNHLNMNIEEDYKYLIDGKILFQNNEDLLKHLIQFWQNPKKWWFNESTQNYIKQFINLYSKKPEKNYLKDLKKIIINS